MLKGHYNYNKTSGYILLYISLKVSNNKNSVLFYLYSKYTAQKITPQDKFYWISPFSFLLCYSLVLRNYILKNKNLNPFNYKSKSIPICTNIQEWPRKAILEKWKRRMEGHIHQLFSPSQSSYFFHF